MSTIRPIPKKLLIHSVEYEEFLEDDRWGDGFADPVTIDFVLVQPATALNRTSNREEITAQHVLFIDRVHSSPIPKLKEKSKVTFEGRDWEVHRVNPYYAFGPDPHHWEVELA